MNDRTLNNHSCLNLSMESLLATIVESILVGIVIILLIIYRPGAPAITEAGSLLLMYSAFALGGAVLFYEIDQWSFWVSFFGATGSIAAGLVIGGLYVTPGALWWMMLFYYSVGVIGVAKVVHDWFESVVPRLFGLLFEALVICVTYCVIA